MTRRVTAVYLTLAAPDKDHVAWTVCRGQLAPAANAVIIDTTVATIHGTNDDRIDYYELARVFETPDAPAWTGQKGKSRHDAA